MTKTEEPTTSQVHLLTAAKDLAYLMYHWNVVDQRELVIEDRWAGTPYHHVTTALAKVLELLGLGVEDKMDFYDMVTTGMGPAEAWRRILDGKIIDEEDEG